MIITVSLELDASLAQIYNQILNEYKTEYVLQKPTRNKKGNTKS